jgi:hypothetical protein
MSIAVVPCLTVQLLLRAVTLCLHALLVRVMTLYLHAVCVGWT